MRGEALVFDGNDRIDEVRWEICQANQLALRAVWPVVGTELFGLEKHRTQAAAPRGLVDLFDRTLADAKHHITRGLRAGGMFESSQMGPDTTALPRILARRKRPTVRCFPVAKTHQRVTQARKLDIEPRVQDFWGGIDP
jgi:hypothetical protein